MKNLKKLSLEDEINREAEEIEKKVKENKEIEGMTVSEDMETALFNKIQEYEYDKRLKKVVYRKKKRTYVIGAIAAIIILICGSVMTSVGSKSYVKVLWERINGDESSNIINVEDMDSKKTKDVDEGQKMDWREESILWMVNAPFPKQESQECTAMDQQQRTMKWINLQ